MSKPHGLPSLKLEYAKILVSTTRCRSFSVPIFVSANDNMTGELFNACLSSPKDCSNAVQNFMSYTNTFSTKRLMAGTTSVSIVDTPAKDNTKSNISLKGMLELAKTKFDHKHTPQRGASMHWHCQALFLLIHMRIQLGHGHRDPHCLPC